MKGSKKEIVKIGTIFVKATYAKNENKMWDKMWNEALNRAAKFAKDVKSAQEKKIIAESITVENYQPYINRNYLVMTQKKITDTKIFVKGGRKSKT